MRTAARSGAAAAVLVTVLGASFGAGAVLRPAFPLTARAADRPAPGAAAADGYALLPRTTALPPDTPGEYVFTVDGPAGLAGPPRLTAVRRDAGALRRAIAVAGADGTWHAPLTLPAGPYRVLVEVTPPGGPARILAADLDAPGPFRPAPFTPARVAEVDGYQVRLDGDLVAGGPAQVFATVSRAGVPVTDLEPVEGGFGRLTAVREGDLAVVAGLPDAAPPGPRDRAGPGTAFSTPVPAPGRYRLFLDFRHGGAPHTAVFAVATS